jgi:hypothetical protein
VGRAAIIWILASGCFDPKYNDPLCGPNGECPTGLTCTVGVCRVPNLGDAQSEPIDVTPDIAHDAAPCPAGYNPNAAAPNRYKIVTATPATWDTARMSCINDSPRAYLWIPNDVLENNAFALSGTRWIGVSDLALEGQWVTVNGGPATYQPWQAGSPVGDGDCVAATELGGGDAAIDVKWDDKVCTTPFAYICECE